MVQEQSDHLQEFMRAYLRHCSERRCEDVWAWEEMDAMAREEPDKAWETILKLLSAAPSKKVVAFIAAGPLEDLLLYHGAMILERLKSEIEHNTRLKYAISHVMISQGAIASELNTLRLKYDLANISHLEF